MPLFIFSLFLYRFISKQVSKLYTCLDLQKFDEATQACNVILDLREAHAQSDGVPEIEEKCVKAIVGGTIRQFRTAQASPDKYSVESARRSILRVHGLLDRIGSTSASTMPWVFESLAYLHEEVGADDKALEYLMQVCNKESQLCASVNHNCRLTVLLRSLFVLPGISHAAGCSRLGKRARSAYQNVQCGRTHSRTSSIGRFQGRLGQISYVATPGEEKD